MDIKVLGPGCANCGSTLALLEQVARERGIPATFSKVEDMKDIMAFGVMSTPGVVIDGTVVHAGGVPTRARIEQWFSAFGKEATGKAGGCCAGSSKSKCCG